MAAIQEKVQHVLSTTVGYRCDVCGKEVREDSPKGWFDLSYGHGEWGNDSIDSLERRDACSVACLTIALGKAVEELQQYERSAYFRLNDFDLNAAKGFINFLP